MPLEELATGLFGIIGRIIGYVFLEFLLEIAMKGPGYMIVRMLTKSKHKDIDPDGGLVIIVGIIFWVVATICAYGVYLAATSNQQVSL